MSICQARTRVAPPPTVYKARHKALIHIFTSNSRLHPLPQTPECVDAALVSIDMPASLDSGLQPSTGAAGSLSGTPGSVVGAVGSATGVLTGVSGSGAGVVGSATGALAGAAGSGVDGLGSATGLFTGLTGSAAGTVGSVAGAAGSVAGGLA
ncbi:hypothetical protein BD779DRAFT_1788134 [Infundibulicybe gibba]|nr:hypothetical protein BD779DRAFT_1788134 [Infundibulicybe gibba]